MYKDITKSISASASRATDEQDASIGRNIELDRMIAEDALDLSEDIPEPEPVVSREGLPVCTRDTITVVSGPAKSRKTFLASALAGACLADEGHFCGFESKGLNKLLWIDTEMAKGHVAKVARRLHRIAGLKENRSSEDIEVYMLKKHTRKDRYDIFKRLIELKRPDLVVLDGVADLVSDVNSLEQAEDIAQDFGNIAEEYHLSMVVVLHTNEYSDSDEPRGHLGSTMLRKADCTILVKRIDKDFSSVTFTKARGLESPDFCFFIDDKGLPKVADINLIKTLSYEKLFSEIMEGKDYWTHGELCDAIKKKGNVSKETAKRRITDATGNVIKKSSANKKYYLITKNDDIDNLGSF